jgi:hypothetical protein
MAWTGWSYSLVAYIFVSIVLEFTLLTTLLQSGRMIAGILGLLLVLGVLILFGMRWFGTSSTSPYKGAWPPIINMCPDYLVYFKNGGADTCVDLGGVNRSNGALKAWTKEDSPAQPPSDPTKYFNYIYKRGMSEVEITALCRAAMSAGLTWEGITNGESCTYLPRSTVGGSNDGASAVAMGSCPPSK